MKYRKKPVVIEAHQFDGTNGFEIAKWAHEGMSVMHNAIIMPDGDILCVRTLESGRGIHFASKGDWIIKGIKGEFYPCKPDIFAMTYEPADIDQDRQWKLPGTTTPTTDVGTLLIDPIKPWDEVKE